MKISFFFSGDMVNSQSKKEFIDDRLKKIIAENDISICNFEAPLYHENMQPIKKAGPHVYNSRLAVQYLKENGFNLVSLANNHIYDYGQKGLEETIAELKRHNIEYVGGGLNWKEVYTPKIIEKRGLKIGLLATCENEFGCLYEMENRGGYAWIFHDKIEDNVRNLKNQCDFIVLIAHAGVEDLSFPIKEWRDRYRRLCDVGVDVVIGHHPHVPQGYERYNNSLIFYSLGNFYFDTPAFANSSDDSYSVKIFFERGKIPEFEIVYHKKIDGKVCLVSPEKVNFSIESLNKLLENDYEKRNEEISVELFYKHYLSYYKLSVGCSFLTFLARIKRKFFGPYTKYPPEFLLLLHNIRIDSHRFIVQRALKVMFERK